jgi:hypothetical protein
LSHFGRDLLRKPRTERRLRSWTGFWLSLRGELTPPTLRWRVQEFVLHSSFDKSKSCSTPMRNLCT